MILLYKKTVILINVNHTLYNLHYTKNFYDKKLISTYNILKKHVQFHNPMSFFTNGAFRNTLYILSKL